MDILKGAQTAVNFALYYPILQKATADNDSPCPGYVYEEIIKLSHISEGHRSYLVDFLTTRLLISQCSGKQKVVNVLRHLAQKGHPGVRCLLRLKDTQLRAVAGPVQNVSLDRPVRGGQDGGGSFEHTVQAGGGHMLTPDQTPQLLLSASMQDLLSELFDAALISSDEEALRSHGGAAVSMPPGMGACVQRGLGGAGISDSKYQGFGSSTADSAAPSVVSKVRGLVDRILWPEVGELSPTAKAILAPDRGAYTPFEIPTAYLPELTPCISAASAGGATASLSELSTSTTASTHYAAGGRPAPAGGQRAGHSLRHSVARAHRVGKAGGGWDDDQEDEDDPPLPRGGSPLLGASLRGTAVAGRSASLPPHPTAASGALTAPHSVGASQVLAKRQPSAEDELLRAVLTSAATWPPPYDAFMQLCGAVSAMDVSAVLCKMAALLRPEAEGAMASLCITEGQPPPAGQLLPAGQLALLTLVDVCQHDDSISPVLIKSLLLTTLTRLAADEAVEAAVRRRARRLALVSRRLAEVCERRGA